MNIELITVVLLQVLVGSHLLYPLILHIKYTLSKRKLRDGHVSSEKDYAIIVTAYEQTSMIPNVVSSLLNLDYSNYQIYVIADNCDISTLHFKDPRVLLLRPETVLSSNVKSHFYAINNFVRDHELITIIDSDNLVHPDYLKELNRFFDMGFAAAQGVRRAKNLNSHYACLDEAGDIYYRFVDRKLLFNAGSSASLAGSGMAFTVSLYKDCLQNLEMEGAGFDKLLQYEIVRRDHQIAFAELAIVYDEKTAKSDQLVKQRARWINSWFKYASLGFELSWRGVKKFNTNQLFFGMMLMRPPLFMLFIAFGICFLYDIVYLKLFALVWVLLFVGFLYVFIQALKHFEADPRIYRSLRSYPRFFYFQVLALLKANKANKLSVATKHEHSSTIEDIETRI